MRRLAVLITLHVCGSVAPIWAQHQILLPEQRQIELRDATRLAPSRFPETTSPTTVGTDMGTVPDWHLSLDEAIRIALQNTEVVRVLSGVGAASSGLTIYSPAISNTSVDQARSIFDPTVTARNNFLHNETPSSTFDPLDPNRAIILGSRADSYDFLLDLNKRLHNGADAGLRVGTNRNRLRPGIFSLNPQSTSDVELSLTQPLFRGRGTDVNAVPIVLAFIDTERSYFRLKNSLQTTVLGVIQGYWDLVQARTEVEIVMQQIRQARFINDFNEERLGPLADEGDVAQSRATLANFEANLVAARASVLNRVASLRGILGLPPGSDFMIVPTTPHVFEEREFDWNALLSLAEMRRPDLIELKLILEADEQRILQARNLAQPRLDATALYRWNGLEGEMPIGDRLEADPGDHTDWALGVTFSVPLTLRGDRANLRQNELLLMQDRAQLSQGLLEASHRIAFSLRTIEQLQQQYVVFKRARTAARANLDLQFEEFRTGRTNFVDVLLAINTWASTITSESQSATRLKVEFATLELETGTILETHGVRLFEERYCSLGPMGRWGKGGLYPESMIPTENTIPRYPTGTRPSEKAFEVTPPDQANERSSRLPPVEMESLR